MSDEELHGYVTACLMSLRRGLQVGELPPGFFFSFFFSSSSSYPPPPP